MTLSLVVFANYRYDQLNPKTTDIVFLTVIMYFFVFANTIVLLLREFFRGQDRNIVLETEQEKLKKGYLLVKSQRKNINVEFGTIRYIESVGNYVKINPVSEKPIMTKEKISTIENKLPGKFIRIHRSILVNADHITSFNREWVNMDDLELPISRKYKEAALNRLNAL